MDLLVGWFAENWIALLSLLVAVVSAIIAWRASRTARKVDHRATERNHVDLDLDVDPSNRSLILRNHGTGTLLDLEGTMTFNDETLSLSGETLGPHGSLTFKCAAVANDYMTYLSALESSRYPAGVAMSADSMYSYGWSLMWTTPAGNVGSADSGNLMATWPEEPGD